MQQGYNVRGCYEMGNYVAMTYLETHYLCCAKRDGIHLTVLIKPPTCYENKKQKAQTVPDQGRSKKIKPVEIMKDGRLLGIFCQSL